MKYLFPSLLLLLLAGCQKEEAKIDHTKTDWAFFQLKGEVKTISEKSFSVLNNSGMKGRPAHENITQNDIDREFNEKGQLVNEKKFKIDGSIFEESFFRGKDTMLSSEQHMGLNNDIRKQLNWDAQKNNIGIIRRNSQNKQIDRIAMKYNGNKIAERISYNMQDTPLDRVSYTYDSKGNLETEELFQNLDIPYVKTIYKYYDNNKKGQERRLDKDNKQLYVTNFEYKGDNLIKKQTLGKNDEVEYTEEFTYDAKNNMLTHSTYEVSTNIKTQETYTYDKNNNPITWEFIKTGEPALTGTYKYDTNNNMTESFVIDSQKMILQDRSYSYEYDSHKNWTKKIIKIAKQPLYVLERTITYY